MIAAINQNMHDRKISYIAYHYTTDEQQWLTVVLCTSPLVFWEA